MLMRFVSRVAEWRQQMTETRNGDEAEPRPAEARAKSFQAVREAHRNELAEDYVELIAELISQFGEARPVDIAARMGVTAPTVAKTLDRLAREGLVARAPYRSIFLTPEGAALAEANIALFATDGVEPEMGSWLEPNMVIRVQRSMPLTIEVDGRLLQTRSHHTNPLAVIAEAGIGLIGADYTQPGAETALQPNDTIRVIRVTEDFRTEDVDIPFQTLWQASPDLDIDTQAIISYGENGIQRRRLRVRYENGVEVSQTVDGEWTAREPIDQVVSYGTKITLGVVDTPEGPREYWRVVRMRVTSYTAASSGKAPGDPGYGVTASGRRVAKGVVAIDRSVVAFRSSVYVPGYGIGYAGDTGGGVRGRWIDLGYSESNYVSWSGYVDVYYLTPVPPPEEINYLLPSVLP